MLKSLFNKFRNWAAATCVQAIGRFAVLTYHARLLGRGLSYVAVSIIGCLVALNLFSAASQKALVSFTTLDAFFTAIGGLIGTILALVISLSVIPVQSAADVFSSSVVRLYREDKVTQFIFTTLSIFCLMAFWMAVGDIFGLTKPELVPIAVIMIAVSLDLLRWHHRHINGLLGSNEGISRLTVQIKSHIDRLQESVRFWSKFQWFFLSNEEKKQTTRQVIEKAMAVQIYSRSPIKGWVDEIAEVAHKAIVRQEILRAQLAIFALADVACHFMVSRKDSLVFYPTDTLLVLDSDLNSHLTPIYEHYKSICSNAIDNKSETTAIHIVQALGKIAICLSNLTSDEKSPNRPASLTYLPMGYLTSCLEMSLRAGMDNVAFQGAGVLLDISKAAPVHTDISSVHTPVIKELTKLAAAFLAKGQAALSNRCIINMMSLVHHNLESKHFMAKNIIGDALNNAFLLLSISARQGRLQDTPFIESPVSPVYDLSQKMSLGYLVAKAKDLIEKPKDDYVNPYHEFVDLNEPIRRHLYEVGEKLDLGSSFLLWHIINTIKHISKVYFTILKEQVSDHPDHLRQLEDFFQWYLSFFWLAFSNKKSVEYQNATEATDVLGFIALTFYSLGYRKTVESCVEDIAVIAEAYRDMAPKDTNSYVMVDVLMPVWHIRLYAEKKSDSKMVKMIDEKVAKFFSVKDGESKFAEPLATRKRQLTEHLEENMHFSEFDKSIGVLQALLEKMPPQPPEIYPAEELFGAEQQDADETNK